jgi:hypothetical protein
MNSMNRDEKEEPRWEEGAAAVSPDPTWMLCSLPPAEYK